MAGLGDVDSESDLEGSNSSSTSSQSSGGSRSSSSGDDKYPLYVEDAPFLAVVRTPDGPAVRNKPEDHKIVKRQYQKGSDLKLFKKPDALIKHWMTDWMFKKDKYIYEQETGRNLLEDLRENPVPTIKRLETVISQAPEQDTPRAERKCAVCGEKLMRHEEIEKIMGKRVHPDHTVEELSNAGVIGGGKTKNRRWD